MESFDPFDRINEVTVPDQWDDIMARAADVEDDDAEWAERSRARRRRSAWVVIGAAAAVIGMVSGFLAIDRDRADNGIVVGDPPQPVTPVPAPGGSVSNAPSTSDDRPAVSPTADLDEEVIGDATDVPPTTAPERGAIVRPVFASADCPAAWADGPASETGIRLFVFRQDDGFAVQVVGKPGATPADPFAVVQRFVLSDLPINVDPVEIDGRQVALQVLDNGNGEATWSVGDGSTAYIRSRGLDRADLESIIVSLEPRDESSEIFGFDIDEAASSDLVLLHEQNNDDVVRSGASSECNPVGVAAPAVYRVTSVTGDAVGRYAAVIDRSPPLEVAQVGGSTLILDGPDDPAAPSLDDVVEADPELFAELSLRAPLEEQLMTPPDVEIGGEVEPLLELFDATGDGVPDQTVSLRLDERQGVGILEVSFAGFDGHPDAAFTVVDIDGQGGGGGLSTFSSSETGPVLGFRLSDGPATEPFLLTVKIVDFAERTLQLSPTIRLVPV